MYGQHSSFFFINYKRFKVDYIQIYNEIDVQKRSWVEMIVYYMLHSILIICNIMHNILILCIVHVLYMK